MEPIDETLAAEYRSQFPIFQHTNYLNSCSLGPLSYASREALNVFAELWATMGAPAWYTEWMTQIGRVKALFAQAINAPPDNVTISHSVSSALSSLASAIDYSRRNKVVVAEIDFPTIAYQWLAKRDVEVVFARSPDGVQVPLEEYERLIDHRTGLVATSHVFYASGAVQDVRAIAEVAHRRGARALIDGYHAIGVLPVDVGALGVDYYVGGSLKWVCGGPGLTFVYVAPDVLAATLPQVTGWFAAADQFAFNTLGFTPAASADRMQLGTPAVATVYTSVPALELILAASPERIYERVQRLTGRIVESAQRVGLELASPTAASSRGGAVLLRVADPPGTTSFLAEQGIVIDNRPGKVRLSPHFFNTEADVDQAMGAIEEVQRRAVVPAP